MSTIFKKAFQMLVGGERQDLATGEILSKSEMLQAGARIYDPVDPVPVAPPIGYKREPSMMEVVKGMVLKEKVRRLQEELGADTPEEAEDFDIGEDDDDTPSSHYEYERHEMELLTAFEKMTNHHRMMHEKYGKPLPDYLKPPKPPVEAKTESGGAGGRPPAEGALSAGPEAPKGPSGGKAAS